MKVSNNVLITSFSSIISTFTLYDYQPNLPMGTAYTFKCNKCDYEVLTSGGLDLGMIAVVDTYISKSCKEIVDVGIGRTRAGFY